MAKRRSKKSGGKSPVRVPRKLKRFAAVVVLLLVLQLVVTFVPYEKVPPSVRPVYVQLVALRNKLVRRTGLPIHLYDDRAKVVAGDAELEVYFAPSPDIDDALVSLIDRSKKTLDMCIYDLDLPNVVAALVSAQERGVKVRLVVDTDNLNLPQLAPLERAKVPMMGDGREAIMHDKFVVVDDEWVWTGSYNFTENGTKKNDNNAIMIRSPELAANYATEFSEMWNDQFGPDSPANTVYPHLKIGGLDVRNYFAPEDRVMAELVGVVEQAETSVDLMAFSFTSGTLAEALEERAAKGVKVRCLFDNGQAQNQYSQDEKLAAKGIDVKISANRRGVMHHKVIIVDGKTVVMGSFNFSKNADTQNDENVLVLGSPELGKVYEDEFQRCWDGTKGY